MSSLSMGSKVSMNCLAFEETLNLLEWPRLCEHLATFASTIQGHQSCKNLVMPSDLLTSKLLLQETIEIGELDQRLEGGISFQGIHDIGQIIFRCSKDGIASGEELLEVAETLYGARRLRKQIINSEIRPVLSTLLADLATLPGLETLLKSGLEEGGRLADRASFKLLEKRKVRNSLRLDRRNQLREMLIKYGSILQDSHISDRNGRSVLAVKASLANQINGIVHDSSTSGSTVFVEPQSIVPLGNKIIDIDAQIFEEEQRILKSWSKEVANHANALNNLCQVMMKLDIALARARYGYWLNGVPPIFTEDSQSFHIKDLRHPLLVWQEKYDNGQQVIPISLDIEDHLKVVAITGPNTGGKTVILKSMGLAALMARTGMLLPCKGQPVMPWCSLVLADIGDEQSLQQNLSTFSSHIVRINRILNAVEQEKGISLVLLDEVGAGTDPTEGSALAIALLKTFAEIARLTIATTHFGELKALKYNDNRFENASVAFDVETLTPTYQLQWGIPGKSNALEVAIKLGLDDVVANQAKSLIESNNSFDVNQVISGLEDQRQRQQEAAEEAASLLVKTELLHEELLSSWKKQCDQSEKAQEIERMDLFSSIRKGQEEVKNLIRRLRHKDSDGETARQIGQRLIRINDQHQPQITNKNSLGWTPKVGEKIRLLSLGKAGDVVEISEDGMKLTVRCGSFRSKVDVSLVESLDGHKVNLPKTEVNFKPRQFSSSPKVRTSSNTVDVRGLRVYEAELVVDERLRNTHGPIWVLHGTGTGKLKFGLRSWLETLPYLEKFEDASKNDGGSGCTVIWLK